MSWRTLGPHFGRTCSTSLPKAYTAGPGVQTSSLPLVAPIAFCDHHAAALRNNTASHQLTSQSWQNTLHLQSVIPAAPPECPSYTSCAAQATPWESRHKPWLLAGTHKHTYGGCLDQCHYRHALAEACTRLAFHHAIAMLIPACSHLSRGDLNVHAPLGSFSAALAQQRLLLRPCLLDHLLPAAASQPLSTVLSPIAASALPTKTAHLTPAECLSGTPQVQEIKLQIEWRPLVECRGL